MLDPVGSPAADVGANTSWPVPPGLIVEGSTAGSRGFARLFGQLARARTLVRQHHTLVTLELAPGSWSRNSTSFGPFIQAATDGVWGIRARRLYTNTTPNPHILYVRYNSTVASTIRVITFDGVTVTNNDFVLATTAGLWAFSSVNAVPIPTSNVIAGQEQLCGVSFQAKVNTAGTVYFSTVSLIENET